jgi:hypothetical protein
LFNIHQNAFIKGRNIMDGVLSLHEAGGDHLKIDFEKTYDKVNWDFPIVCHRARGFSEQ